MKLSDSHGSNTLSSVIGWSTATTLGGAAALWASGHVVAAFAAIAAGHALCLVRVFGGKAVA